MDMPFSDAGCWLALRRITYRGWSEGHASNSGSGTAKITSQPFSTLHDVEMKNAKTLLASLPMRLHMPSSYLTCLYHQLRPIWHLVRDDFAIRLYVVTIRRSDV
jgi:hypothetical protein